MNIPAADANKTLCSRLILAIFLQLVICAQSVGAAGNQGVITFPTAVTRPQHQGTAIDYKVDPHGAKFFVYVPPGYSQTESFGLIVYISWAEEMKQLPPGWEKILEQRRFLFVCPQNAGNLSRQDARAGLAVLGALEMMQSYNVDRNRVYAAGLSGGARTACDLGLVQSDIFQGTIQSCGSDFYHEVQKRYATNNKDTNGHPYGLCAATPSEVAEARNKTKFVLITGDGDYRRGNVLDIYNGGFALEGFHAKLLDLPSMGHQDCSGETLLRALDFLGRYSRE